MRQPLPSFSETRTRREPIPNHPAHQPTATSARAIRRHTAHLPTPDGSRIAHAARHAYRLDGGASNGSRFGETRQHVAEFRHSINRRTTEAASPREPARVARRSGPSQPQRARHSIAQGASPGKPRPKIPGRVSLTPSTAAQPRPHHPATRGRHARNENRPSKTLLTAI